MAEMAESAWLSPGEAFRFVDALGDLPAELWHRAGLKARENAFARIMATRALETLARDASVALPRWSLQEDVETAAWYGLPAWYRSAEGWSRPRELLDAVQAAHLAAIAVLLRLRLGERRFQVLYAPFADFVPRSASCQDERA